MDRVRAARFRPAGSTADGRGRRPRSRCRTLSRRQAKGFYDRFGSLQDLQRFYEDPAIEVLLEHAGFEGARAVVELGCGTGRLARRLLAERLPEEATYVGVDLSTTMVRLAQERLSAWPGRSRVRRTAGEPEVPVAAASCDRFLSVYVLDLLATEDARAVVAEAHRVLRPGGRLCLASLTFGRGVLSRAVSRLWTAVHARRPEWVGGCRPIGLLGLLGHRWDVLHHEVVCTLGLCTEVVVAAPQGE